MWTRKNFRNQMIFKNLQCKNEIEIKSQKVHEQVRDQRNGAQVLSEVTLSQIATV